MTSRARYWARVCCTVAFSCLTCLSGVNAQQAPMSPTALTPVPRFVWVSGSFHPADGLPAAAVETATLAVYHDQ